jgi:AcrR family transcriptional regulator
MEARAQAVEETRRRLVEVAIRLFSTRPYDLVSLRTIAEESGVALATVVRQFGTKERLFTAGAATGQALIESGRDEAPVGDVDAAVGILVASYEAWGDSLAHLIAQEARVPALHGLLEHGRLYHRAWVKRVFTPFLRSRAKGARARRVALFAAATDVLFWKILRRDFGLSVAETVRAIAEVISALAEEG